jgi:hypothetical protein
MGKRRLRVQVEKGVFKSERTVSFQGKDGRYSLIVDEEDVQDETIEVYVIARNEQGELLISLPNETFTSGNRALVREDELLLSPPVAQVTQGLAAV